jgi:hypothetical protein
LSGAALAPGASPGALTVNSDLQWSGGVTYDWEINDATGTAGTAPGWDLLSLSGKLLIAATPGNPFAVNARTLLGSAAGPMANFNSASAYAWKIASAATEITGFDPAKFTLNTVGIANAAGGGTFALTQTGSDLQVMFSPAANHVPVANAYSMATDYGQPAILPIAVLLAQAASDADHDLLTLTAVSRGTATSGAVVIGSGFITYTPLAGFTGADSFTYSITDGHGGAASGLVTVMVRSNKELTFNLALPEVLPGGGFRIRCVGFGGQSYTLQRSPNVNGPWTTLASITIPAAGVATFDDLTPLTPQGFYRMTIP